MAGRLAARMAAVSARVAGAASAAVGRDPLGVSRMVAAVLAMVVVASVLAAPQVARAVPNETVSAEDMSIIGSTLRDTPILGPAIDLAEAAIDPPKILRDFDNLLLTEVNKWTLNTADGSLISRSFEMLLGSASSISTVLKSIHDVAVIPIANIVLLIFMVWGLVQVTSRASTADTGIDFMKLVIVFVFYGIAKTIVDASWELMVLMFDLSQQLVVNIGTAGSATVAASNAVAIPEEVSSIPTLIFIMLAAFICFLITFVVCLLSNAVVIVRGIQIYVMTCLSPIPLAFMVSEGGRDVTKRFLKSYAAILLSGAILMVVFIMFSLAAQGSMLASAFSWDYSSGETILGAINEALYGLGVYIAFAWVMFKSGSWSRDFVGL